MTTLGTLEAYEDLIKDTKYLLLTIDVNANAEYGHTNQDR